MNNHTLWLFFVLWEIEILNLDKINIVFLYNFFHLTD